MLGVVNRWFRRNRTKITYGVGAVSAIYLAGQYAWGKWLEAQQRIAEERIARENLRRRFEQNQEDCTFTVLALLPTIHEELFNLYAVEEISEELQKQRTDKLARSVGNVSNVTSLDSPSSPPSAIEDSGSLNSFPTGSYVHANRLDQSASGQSQTQAKRNKSQLWGDMKIQSITRAITLIYSLSLLTILTRIQLNLLGRRTYLSSVVSLASPPPQSENKTISMENNDDDNYDMLYGNDFDTNRQYLTFSWWLLHKGCKDIAAQVEQAVKQTFGPINPREEMTLENLSTLLLDIRKAVEGTTEQQRTEKNWLSVVLPPADQQISVLNESSISRDNDDSSPASTHEYLSTSIHQTTFARRSEEQTKQQEVSPFLRHLLDETSDLIDSSSFTHVLTQTLDAAFSILVDKHIATEAFRKTLPKTSDNQHTSSHHSTITDLPTLIPEQQKAKLAQILAVFCRQAHAISSSANRDESEILNEDILFGPLDNKEGGASLHHSNEYLRAIDSVPDLEGFAAVIYSSHFDTLYKNTTKEHDNRKETGKNVMDNKDVMGSSTWTDKKTRHSDGKEDEKGSNVEEMNEIEKEIKIEMADTEYGADSFENAWNRAIDDRG